MKKESKFQWKKIMILSALFGIAFITADWIISSYKKDEDVSEKIYDGPVQIEKEKAFVTKATIENSEYDFGKVNEGDTIKHVFYLVNAGEEPLMIFKSAGSCDCVAANFSSELIPVGGTTPVTVYFNTKGRKGAQTRKVTLTCNTQPAEISLIIKGEIL